MRLFRHTRLLPIAALVAASGLTILGCGGSTARPQPPLAVTHCCQEIYVLGDNGSATPVTEGERPKWSPDHRSLAFTRADYEAEPGPTNDIWSINRDGTGLRRLTYVPAPNQVRFIAYGGRPPIIAYDDDYGIWTMRPDGSGKQILARAGNANDLAISPDGSKLAYASGSTKPSSVSLRVIDLHDKHREVAFPGTTHTCSVSSPSWSPDSAWIAFSLCVNKGGFNTEEGLWLVRPDGSGLHRIAMTATSPTWSPTGEWIAFDTQKTRPHALGELTAIAEVHPDGSGYRLVTPFTAEGSEPYEELDW